jgi:hypothetical protein
MLVSWAGKQLVVDPALVVGKSLRLHRGPSTRHWIEAVGGVGEPLTRRQWLHEDKDELVSHTANLTATHSPVAWPMRSRPHRTHD